MLNKHAITDIFFDLDHTLWDFEKNSALAFQLLFDRYKIEIDVPRFLATYEPINLQYWKLYREEKIDKENMRRKRLTDTFAKFNVRYSTDYIDALAESYINFLPLNNYLLEGTVEILDYLKPKYQLHIITNGFEEVQHKKLFNSNIHHYFKTVTNSERVGVKKPNPKIFYYALQQANTTSEKSVMIGDNLEADILGAEAVGIKSVLLTSNHQEKWQQTTIEKLSQLRDLL